ncbi:uncharacterized protein DS421_1g17960 [Arachis hypogaea]|nr:uncharacterized protein DS421_1g17960 [Arachis hypogaea]
MSLPLMYLVMPYPLELPCLELAIRESNLLPPSFNLASIISGKPEERATTEGVITAAAVEIGREAPQRTERRERLREKVASPPCLVIVAEASIAIVPARLPLTSNRTGERSTNWKRKGSSITGTSPGKEEAMLVGIAAGVIAVTGVRGRYCCW